MSAGSFLADDVDADSNEDFDFGSDEDFEFASDDDVFSGDDAHSDVASAHAYSDFDDSHTNYASGDRDAALLADHVNLASGAYELGTQVSQEGRSFKLRLSMHSLSAPSQAALGVSHEGRLTVEVDAAQGYKSTSPLPQVTVRYLAPNTSQAVETSTFSPNPRFALGVLLAHAATAFLRASWRHRSDTFVLDLFNVLQNRAQAPGDTCMLCDATLAHGGINPTVCDDALCTYQFETLGLGANLDLVETSPALADLLVSTTLAAVRSAPTRPYALPNRPAGADGTVLSIEQMRLLLESLPPFSREASLPEPSSRSKALSDPLPEVSNDAKRLLRWVFASNRAHITPLEPSAQFASMATRHQFKIHSSTRRHEAEFQSLKQQHGSLFAFHGSPFGNWHNILRNNLQNASHTPMMTTGAAFGAGIYLATQSWTSTGYALGAPSWSHSLFGASAKCLAICEVIGAPSLIRASVSDILVAPLEALVTLRYLFVYSDYEAIPAISINSLSLQQYRNALTLGSREPIAEVPKDELIVTSDGYAWQVDDLVAWVSAKNGLFINGYTQQSFAPKDVSLIMGHPRANAALTALERANVALRQRISAATKAFARNTGAILKNDHSSDFAPSFAAVAALQKYIDGLVPEERDALARAPFEAVDSHSREPMRDTLINGIDSVAQGGLCIHKFGDFLSQLPR